MTGRFSNRLNIPILERSGAIRNLLSSCDSTLFLFRSFCFRTK
nr:MAG TPA: hypothetical protein [Caudoviricetes sp.]